VNQPTRLSRGGDVGPFGIKLRRVVVTAVSLAPTWVTIAGLCLAHGADLRVLGVL